MTWISLGVCSGPTGKEHQVAAVFQSFPELCSATATAVDGDGSGNQKQMKSQAHGN